MPLLKEKTIKNALLKFLIRLCKLHFRNINEYFLMLYLFLLLQVFTIKFYFNFVAA
jgi:hypothetical protein